MSIYLFNKHVENTVFSKHIDLKDPTEITIEAKASPVSFSKETNFIPRNQTVPRSVLKKPYTHKQ